MERRVAFRSKKALFRLADLMEREAAQLDALDAEEMGKPISEAAFYAAAAAGLVRFYAESVDKVSGVAIAATGELNVNGEFPAGWSQRWFPGASRCLLPRSNWHPLSRRVTVWY